MLCLSGGMCKAKCKGDAAADQAAGASRRHLPFASASTAATLGLVSGWAFNHRADGGFKSPLERKRSVELVRGFCSVLSDGGNFQLPIYVGTDVQIDFPKMAEGRNLRILEVVDGVVSLAPLVQEMLVSHPACLKKWHEQFGRRTDVEIEDLLQKCSSGRRPLLWLWLQVLWALAQRFEVLLGRVLSGESVDHLHVSTR